MHCTYLPTYYVGRRHSHTNNEKEEIIMLSSPHVAPPPPLPIIVKPTSRGRGYRIPNTNDSALSTGATAGGSAPASSSPPRTGGGDSGGGGGNDDNDGNDGQSFLWATREMAALDFLTNVPLRAERDIVRAGLSGGCNRIERRRRGRHPPIKDAPDEVDEVDEAIEGDVLPPPVGSIVEGEGAGYFGKRSSSDWGGGGRWWDKLVLKDKRFFSAANQQAQRRERMELEEKELELPTESKVMLSTTRGKPTNGGTGTTMDDSDDRRYGDDRAEGATTIANGGGGGGVPGRRLDGREAAIVVVPEKFRLRPAPHRVVAREAAVREWEIKVTYGNGGGKGRGAGVGGGALLDGRVFFATRMSYPVAVFSTIKYEPKKEETLRRRKQLEELGGGGTQFVLPERDWSEFSRTFSFS
jgi:hypothetical protein